MIDGQSPHKDTPIVLAIDVGTTNAKAQFFDGEARPLGRALRAGMPVRPDGTADADLLAAEVEKLLDRALADAEEVVGKKTPEAVALTCAWHGLVGLDRDGNPLTALSTWFDSRAAAQALRLRARVSDLDALHDRTGAPIHPALPPARLLRLREEEPALFDRVARWASLGEFLHIRWFGPEVPASPSMASGSGLYDQSRRGWDPELCRLLELRPETLPRVRDGRYLGSELRLREPFANRWPVLRNARWTPASGDGGAAVVGSVACAGEAGLTVGTSAAARVVIPFSQRAGKPLPRALFAYLLEEDRAVVGVARSNAGNLIGWGRRLLYVVRRCWRCGLWVCRSHACGTRGNWSGPTRRGPRLMPSSMPSGRVRTEGSAPLSVQPLGLLLVHPLEGGEQRLQGLGVFHAVGQVDVLSLKLHAHPPGSPDLGLQRHDQRLRRDHVLAGVRAEGDPIPGAVRAYTMGALKLSIHQSSCGPRAA